MHRECSCVGVIGDAAPIARGAIILELITLVVLVS